MIHHPRQPRSRLKQSRNPTSQKPRKLMLPRSLTLKELNQLKEPRIRRKSSQSKDLLNQTPRRLKDQRIRRLKPQRKIPRRL